MACYKYFTAVHKVLHVPGREGSEKMCQFAKGEEYEDLACRRTYYFDFFTMHIKSEVVPSIVMLNFLL